MAKNYKPTKIIVSDFLAPRKIVIDRILTFSKSYKEHQTQFLFFNKLRN